MGLQVSVTVDRCPGQNFCQMRAFDEGEAPEAPPSWEDRGEDLAAASRFLFPGERRVLELIWLGRTPNEVAAALGLPSRQAADKAMRCVLDVLRFYAERRELMERAASLELSEPRQRMLEAFLFRRVSFEDVARAEGVGRRVVTKRMSFLIDHLRRWGYADVAGLLEETWKNRKLRASVRVTNGKRRAMMAEPWRADLKELLFKLVGRVRYGWGSQRIDWERMEGDADCSGLVIECLKRVGRLPTGFRDVAAQGLYGYYNKRTRSPQLGDLVFYGKETKVDHVMFYLGRGQFPAGQASIALQAADCVIGMCGGEREMSAADAHWLGATLLVRTSPRYRKDFLGYGVVR